MYVRNTILYLIVIVFVRSLILVFCCVSGYIGSVSFLNTVLQVVERLRSINPGLIYGNYVALPLYFVLIVFYHCH